LERNKREVCYYFRNPGPGKFSIENVFKSLIEVNKYWTVSTFYTRRTLDFGSFFRVKKAGIAIHHITGAANYLALILPRKRTIITVHDIGHYLKTLRGWRKQLYKYVFWKWPLNRVAAITAISEFSKKELIKHFGVLAEKITVIPNPVNPAFKYVMPGKNSSPVILQIGAGKNKNIEILVDSVRGLGVKLMLIRPPDSILIERLISCEVAYEFRTNLSEVELIQAYADSDIVYFASTYEGFGLPILEGMAIGRPVITSAISPMKEIAGDAALLVDPGDVNQVKDAIIRLMNSTELYNHLVHKGIEHAKRYDVESVARQYFSLYKKIATDCE